MSIAEIIQDVCAITILGVTKLDYFAQLAPLKVGAPGYVGGIDAQAGCRNTVQHDDAARASGGVFRRRAFAHRRWGRDARSPSKSGPASSGASFPGRGVASSAPDFLIIGLDGSGHLIVSDKANVRLVDAHTKSISGHDHLRAARHEFFLGFDARRITQASMIGRHL